MHKKLKLICGLLLGLILVVVTTGYLKMHNVAMFDTAGVIATKERQLIILTAVLALIVVVPVFSLLFIFAWRYREENTGAAYTPDAKDNRVLEVIWWLIPIAIIVFLAAVTWRATHELDPAKALVSSKKPLTVQVVALDWKWLFIYPEQNVASVNYLAMPVGTPVNFEITSDAPMNSFWIPNLGGQIYAMSGMSTQLHLEADKAGDYPGVSANISGTGFSGMKFTAHAGSDADFAAWVQRAKHAPQQLSAATYDKLAKPSENNPVTLYASSEPDLYDTIVMKYMAPGQVQ